MSDDPRSTREAIDAEVEALLSMAADARRAFREGDAARIASLYEQVRERADGARGALRALSEVAEAFLGVLARGVYSRDTITLLRFAEQSPEATRFITAATGANGVSIEEREALPEVLREQARELESLGVLVAGGGRLTVRRGLRPIARDLAVPPLLRMWKQVQGERARVAFSSGLSRGDRPRVLASVLGITESQAKAHLAEFPLENAMATAAARHGTSTASLYQRGPWTPPRPLFADGDRAVPTDTDLDESDVSPELVTVANEAVPSDVFASGSELN